MMRALVRGAASRLALGLRLVAVAVMFAAAAAPAVRAVQPDEVMADPAQEARARALSARLRCMVCQNQSIDDSDAPLARDLRVVVREKIAAGATDDEIIDFLVVRYGEFVLLEPRFSLHNLMLWLAAPAVLVAGGFLVWRFAVKRGGEPPPLTEAEKRRIATLLDKEP